MRKVPRIDECQKVPLPGKHRYVMPLDAAMRAQCATLAQPYPKRGRSREIATAPPGQRAVRFRPVRSSTVTNDAPGINGEPEGAAD